MLIVRFSIVSALASGVLFPGSVKGEWLCWSADKNNQIQCAQPDGSQQRNLLSASGKPMGMGVDRMNDKLYWVEHDVDRIMSVGLVGTVQASTVVQVPGNAGLRGMAVASSIGKVYWAAEDHRKIQRANLDGSQIEDLAVPDGSFFDVEVDEVNNALYWTNGNEIWRGNFDGSSAVPIVGDGDQPYYMALDVAAGKLYWTDFALNEIGRADLDGSNRESPGPIHDLLERPIGIALDVNAGKVYWTLESGTVQRANLDGSNIETVLDGLESTWDIAIVASLPTAVIVPAASSWGLAILALMLLTAGTVMTANRQQSWKTETASTTAA